MESVIFIIILIILGIVAYFLPAIIADQRKHKQRMSICVLNLLLGWTVIGWVISIVWAVSANVEEKKP